MDPWVEHPALWPGVHQRLITYACDALQERVGPRYFVEIGERIYMEQSNRSIYPDVTVSEAPTPRSARGSGGATSVLEADAPRLVHVDPGVEVREPYLEVHDTHQGERVVTVIEVLSPANKRPGAGREEYLRKQAEVLASQASLVEIDLLRAGEPTVALPWASASDRSQPYRVVVSRSTDRRTRELYACGLRERLPRVALPLVAPDPDVVLDLPAVFALAWERGAYARRLDRAREPVPPLAPEDLAWARELTATR